MSRISNLFKPPDNIAKRNFKYSSLFLAGSIEMGKAENWQSKVEEYFRNYQINIFNPRRDDWDNSWKQDISNPHFYQQVDWELNALEIADVILMHFESNTMSPISLFELGLFARSKKIIVSCRNDFYRRGNVEIVCQKYNIPYYDDLEQAIRNIKLPPI